MREARPAQPGGGGKWLLLEAAPHLGLGLLPVKGGHLPGVREGVWSEIKGSMVALDSEGIISYSFGAVLRGEFSSSSHSASGPLHTKPFIPAKPSLFTCELSEYLCKTVPRLRFLFRTQNAQ